MGEGLVSISSGATFSGYFNLFFIASNWMDGFLAMHLVFRRYHDVPVSEAVSKV